MTIDKKLPDLWISEGMGRYGTVSSGMCLRSEHFLHPALQMVPHSCPAAGQAVGNRTALLGQHETVCCLRAAISTRLQPGKIL